MSPAIPNSDQTRQRKSEAPGVATDRKVTATPELRTGARAATCCSLHHWAVTRRAMRRLERSVVRSRCTNVPYGSPPDPAQQFAQHNPTATAKDGHRPGLPQQNVHELVKLRIGHIHICCEFHAKRAALRLLELVRRRPEIIVGEVASKLMKADLFLRGQSAVLIHPNQSLSMSASDEHLASLHGDPR